MQAALTFEEAKQRTLVPKHVVGLTAALLTSAAITPMNMQAVQGIARLEEKAGSQINKSSVDIPLLYNDNLKVMEEQSGTELFSCVNVNSIRLIETTKELLQIREEIKKTVLSWQGISYKWGGRSRTGVDCSGLVQQVFKAHGINLPRTSYEQFREGVGIPRANLEAGDLVFFNTNGAGASHVGIYLEDGKFISATKTCVKVQSLDQAYWAKTYRGARRVISSS